MHSLPFDKPGRFWRGNLHLHSTNSDGRRSPEETLAGYRERGYDFVSLTDHFLPKGGVPPAVSDTVALRRRLHDPPRGGNPRSGPLVR